MSVWIHVKQVWIVRSEERPKGGVPWSLIHLNHLRSSATLSVQLLDQDIAELGR